MRRTTVAYEYMNDFNGTRRDVMVVVVLAPNHYLDRWEACRFEIGLL